MNGVILGVIASGFLSSPPISATQKRLLMTGDSTTWGYGSNGAAIANARVKSPPVLMSEYATANGVPSTSHGVFGRGGAGSNAQITSHDPRIANLGVFDRTTINVLGGGAHETAFAPIGDLQLDVVSEFDTIEIFAFTYPASTPIAIRVWDGTTEHIIGSMTLNDPIGLKKESFSVPSGLSGYQLRLSAPDYAYMIGFEPRKANTLTVSPAGWSGQQSSNYATTNGVYDPQDCAAFLGADALWVNQGINDAVVGETQLNFEAYYRTYLDAFTAANPTAKLFLQIPNDTVSGLSYVPSSIETIAAEYSATVLDTRDVPNMSNFATANGAGLMFDNWHPNGAGYQAIIDYFGPIVLAELYP